MYKYEYKYKNLEIKFLMTLKNTSYFEQNVLFYFSDEFSCGCQCTCYTDVQTRALVADCSNLGLVEIPQNLPNYTDWLIVSGNNISSLNQEILQTPFLPHLTKIDISGNSLTNISNEFIALYANCGSRLSLLDISRNNLKMLPRHIQNVSSLRNLRLSGNPFTCSCGNIWIKDSLNNSDAIDDSTNVTCTMPSGEEIRMIDVNPKLVGCPSPKKPHNRWKILGFIS